jgi:5-methylcytosine-specific restriction endonuclease McrA
MYESCQHDRTELRHMEHCQQYRKQCLDCFQSVGNAIAKRTIPVNELESMKPFDIQARDGYWENRKSQAEKIQEQILQQANEKLQARRNFYETYLQSDDWRNIRKRVIERENGLCQGCRMNPISQVHHRNYDRLGSELLTDLYGYCETCHKKAHDLV